MNRKRLLTIVLFLVIGSATLFGERFPILYDLIPFVEDLLGSPTIVGLEGPVRLVRVTDGDTLVVRLDGQEEKVRLIGIDTPEKYDSDKLRRDAEASRQHVETIKRLGREASAYTEDLVQGKTLYLELDASSRDRYGRLLAYVYTLDEAGRYRFGGETFEQVNLRIVEGGWAEPLTIPPNIRYADDFVRASRQAKGQDKGMWGELR